MVVPLLDVSHLPSSTSFYLAVLQPLGLSYLQLSCPADDQPPVPTVTFGQPGPLPQPVLQLRQVTKASGPLQISRIVVSAASPEIVALVRERATRAKAGGASLDDNLLLTQKYEAGKEQQATTSITETITDLDGNIMEVMSRRDYSPSYYPDYPAARVRHTQSTTREAEQILSWNYNVSKSPPESASGASPAHSWADRALGHPTSLRRSVTTTYEYPIRQDSGGISPGTVAGLAAVGMAVGVGVGAALTYSTMKTDRSRVPVHEFEAPPVRRMSTYPARLPSERSGPSDRYIEVERRSVPRIGYGETYGATTSSPLRSSTSQYAGGYSTAGSSSRKIRAVDDMYDGRSRHPSRYEGSQPTSSRTRSEAGSARAPLLLTEAEHRSHASSRHSSRHHDAPPPSRHSHSHSHLVKADSEGPSYARSHHSKASSSLTVRPSPRAPGPPVAHVTELVTRIKPRSRVTEMTEVTTTVRRPSQPRLYPHMPPNSSRSGSIMSARNVPLPRSSVSGRDSSWEDVADDDSVAPSDSISCAGSRRRSRSHY